MSNEKQPRRFPRDVAQTILHARRLQERAQREGRPLLRPGIEDNIRKLWAAWQAQDIDEAMRLAMSLQDDWCDLVFDNTWREGIDKLIALERAELKKQKVTIHQIVRAIWDEGSVTAAASKLGISRQAINKRLTPRWRSLLDEGMK